MFNRLSQCWIRSRKGSATAGVTNGSTGPKPFSAYDSETAVGDASWTNFDAVALLDDDPANVTLPTLQSEYLSAITSAIAPEDIPVGATIVGFELRVRRRKSGMGSVVDTIVTLRVNGVQTGENKASPTPWSSSYEWVTYGGPTDLWGLTPTRADALATTFSLSCTGSMFPTAEVDYADLNIYYTV